MFSVSLSVLKMFINLFWMSSEIISRNPYAYRSIMYAIQYMKYIFYLSIVECLLFRSGLKNVWYMSAGISSFVLYIKSSSLWVSIYLLEQIYYTRSMSVLWNPWKDKGINLLLHYTKYMPYFMVYGIPVIFKQNLLILRVGQTWILCNESDLYERFWWL